MTPGNIIGSGNTAEVYEWGKDKVLKLFHPEYSKEAAEQEFQNALAINNLDFAKPRAYELMEYKNQYGIIYDKAKGIPLLDWVMKTRKLKACAKYMSALHKSILRNSISAIPDYKAFLRDHIPQDISENTTPYEELMSLIDRLPDGNTLCHGDFHPGNIILYSHKTIAIDFRNICCGHYLYDVARTVFLVEYTPVPKETLDKEALLKLKKGLADLYLKEMDVTRDMINDYLNIITITRRAECPDE